MEEPKKLYRSANDRIIAGVCGGLGKYFSIDPVIFRILFVLLTLLHGAGIIIYIIMIIVIRRENDPRITDNDTIKEGIQDLGKETKEFVNNVRNRSWLSQRRNVIGLIIVLIGFIALASNYFPMAWLDFRMIIIAGIILLGLYIIFKK